MFRNFPVQLVSTPRPGDTSNQFSKPCSRLSARRAGSSRFKSYGCLVAVYRTYKEWKDLKISNKMAGHLAKSFKTPRRKGTSPVRTLIDVTFPALDAKQKSRWSRALEFAALTKARPDQLPNLLKNHSGIAGCARWAAKQKTKKTTDRDDWALDPLNIVVQKKPKTSVFW